MAEAKPSLERERACFPSEMGAKPCAFILNLQNSFVGELANLVRKTVPEPSPWMR